MTRKSDDDPRSSDTDVVKEHIRAQMMKAIEKTEAVKKLRQKLRLVSSREVP